jgi:DNA polymerase bacteriophage-type
VRLFLDTETFSETPIANGTFAYAETVEVMIVSWAVDDGETKVWDVTSTPLTPDELVHALAEADEIIVHNSQFDRTVVKHYFSDIFLPLDKIHDTMSRARAHSLPGGLGKLCEIFSVPVDQAKDKAGHSLIQLFCKPRPKNSALRRATRETHPKEWAQFLDYAKLDISAMRVIYKKLPRWNFEGFEKAFWKTDAIINERGVAIDLDLVNAAIHTIGTRSIELSSETAKATNDEVQKTTQRDRLLEYIEKIYGVKFTDLTASMVDKALNDDSLPQQLKDLLLLRAEASLSSTAKYKKFLNATSKDGRLRGMFVYCGAARTGRAAGQTVQLHNLARPSMKHEDIEIGIDAIKNDCADLLFPNVMSLASNALRGCLIAAPGKKLVISDLSNIEGRVLAWLAGEQWKIDAFRDFDAGVGVDLYKLAYARAFRIDHKDVTKEQRQIGKTLELACGYQGGVGAFNTFATAFGIDLDDLADRAWESIPSDVLEEARGMWEWVVKEKRTLGLSKRAFIASDSLKRMWRRAHPRIEKLWNEVDAQVKDAASYTGGFQGRRFGMLQGIRVGAWTRIVLPSGRSLCYPSMRVDNDGLSYAGVNPYTRQWGRVRTYGGKIVENITQAVARDVLVQGIMNAEASEYPVVAHVHDEIVCEVPDTHEYSVDKLSSFMTTNIPWASGLPLAAAGFETKRYRKE